MRINSVNNQCFGKIYIAKSCEDRAREVIRNFRNESPEYDKTIDYIKYNNDSANIWIDNFGKVDYQIWELGARVNTDEMAGRKEGYYLSSFRERLRFALDEISRLDRREIEKFSKPKEAVEEDL